jgi:hypothetical protein
VKTGGHVGDATTAPVSQLRNGLSLTLPSRILTGGLRHLNLICAALQYLRFITA